jgi:hypothetical protein
LKTVKAFPLLLLLELFGLLTWPSAAQSPQAAVPKPFRVVFKAYDGDPNRYSVTSISFQVATIDKRQPAEFLRLGESIPNTKLKLLKFQFKEAKSPNGEVEDISELTIVYPATGKTATLVMNKVTDVSAVMAGEPPKNR